MKIEKIARLNFCQFSRESSFGLCASPNPRQRLSPLETAILKKRTGTVSQTVSERGGGAVKNSGGVKQIFFDFTGDFAILLASERMFQVAARLGPPAQETRRLWFSRVTASVS